MGEPRLSPAQRRPGHLTASHFRNPYSRQSIHIARVSHCCNPEQPPSPNTSACRHPERRTRSIRHCRPQGTLQKGLSKSVLWSAHDDNTTNCVTPFIFDAKANTSGKLIERQSRAKVLFLGYHHAAGWSYYLKIVTTDAPANPPPARQDGARKRAALRWITRPPVIEGLTGWALPGKMTGGHPASSRARRFYGASSVRSTAWTVAEWILLARIRPLATHSSSTTTSACRPWHRGAHPSSPRHDRFENVGSAKMTFAVPSRKP